MSIVDHHIYEFKKGVRGLFLHTVPNRCVAQLKKKLDSQAIPYEIRELSCASSNIFFGEALCLEVVRKFGNKRLDELSVEEDFILGILLGYGRAQQCLRYLSRSRRAGSGSQDVVLSESDKQTDI